MRTKAKRTIRPSGVEQTDTLFYWKCSVSGLPMFADAKRFADVVEKYGSEENLVKTYVLRPVKKYLEAGYTAEQIKELIVKNDGKLPSLDEVATVSAKPVAEKKEKKVKVEETPVVVEVAKVETKPDVPETPEPKPLYDWQGNPDFFKGTSAPIDFADASKENCFFPNRNLDDQCRGCHIYSICQCSAKYSEEEQKKPPRNEVKIKAVMVD